MICAVPVSSPHFNSGTLSAEEYQPQEKRVILELVAKLAMEPANDVDEASDLPQDLQQPPSTSSGRGESPQQSEQGVHQAEASEAVVVATDIPWKTLKAALRASLKREKFQENKSRGSGGGVKRRGRASTSSGKVEKTCFVQRQPPFCVVELCVDNHHASISNSPNVCCVFCFFTHSRPLLSLDPSTASAFASTPRPFSS